VPVAMVECQNDASDFLGGRVTRVSSIVIPVGSVSSTTSSFDSPSGLLIQKHVTSPPAAGDILIELILKVEQIHVAVVLATVTTPPRAPNTLFTVMLT